MPAPLTPEPKDAPELWRGSTSLIDLEDPRLRLRVQALTQLCRSDREKVLAMYSFVKRMPFAKPVKWRLHTARQVLDAGTGDAADKACLLVGCLRAAGFSARLRYVELHGDILRGLTDAISSAGRPAIEVWLDGRWASTDTYIFDAAYVAAARRRLKRNGWNWGYGLHRLGHTLWDGLNDAFLMGDPELAKEVSMGPVGIFHDPLDYQSSPAYRERYQPLGRTVRWGIVAPGFNRAVSELRDEPPLGEGELPAPPPGKPI